MYRPRLELTLLGTPRLTGAGRPVPLSRGTSTLLAYLALSPAGGRPRDVAAAQLFPNCSEHIARRRLSTALWRLRTEGRDAMGIDLVPTGDADRVQLSPGVGLAVDVSDFERLLGVALSAPPDALSPADVHRLERAVDLHRGPLVESCCDDWVLAERTRLEHLYLTALDTLVVHWGNRENVPSVSRFGELALAMEPLREDVHRHLMAAYARAGRDDLVERQFERCRRMLVDELGADPLPETVALYSRLRCGTDALAPSLAALVADLEQARRDVVRLAADVDRALTHLEHLR